jgi:hypothetical protein|tara:strand:- start:152 stop:550 length:399 start_codon:yes stop_codon:yes gene_type:complete
MNSDSKMDIDIIEEMVFQEVEDILLKEVAQDPGYELKLFVTPVRCSISKTLGGDKTDTFNEIRGIESVTTVSDVLGTVREDDSNYYSTVLVKFELSKGEQPKDFRRKILIPTLKRVKGLIVYNVGGIDQVAK